LIVDQLVESMGAQESTGRSDQQNADGTGTTLIDYYQLLEVNEDATVEEIRVNAKFTGIVPS
jgi:hypothetical protein